MAAVRMEQEAGGTLVPWREGAPPPPPDSATVEERDRYWMEHVYQGERMPQLTLRAIAMGAVIGMVMSISNLYTHLKLGWGFGVAITSCVISFVVWNAIRTVFTTLGSRISKMSVLENACMASTASAAGYATGNTLPMAFGATLLITGTHYPWPATLAFTFFASALGVFVAIPMKRQMINVEQLKFPSGTAAAETLRSLYSEGRVAMQKAYSLLGALFAGGLVGILRAPEGAVPWLDRFIAPARIPDHLDLPPRLAGVTTHKSYGFAFEPSLLLIGAGMIVGMRVAMSMLLGGVLLFMVVGPLLLKQDIAHAGEEGYQASIRIIRDGTTAHFRDWGIWGGSSIIMFASLASLALQWRTIARAFRVFRAGDAPAASPTASVEVPKAWLFIGLVPVGIGMVVVQYLAFDIAVWLGIVAVLLSFVISLACSRATGETDTTPTGAMGKVTQLLYAVLSPGNYTHNLMSAGVTSGAGLSSADLLTDLKTGYLLGANPRKQFFAQFIGCLFGSLAVVPAWYAMVPTKEALEKFEPPAVNTWKAVAEALTKGLDAIPHTAQIAIVVGAIVGVIVPLVSHLAPKTRPFLPSVIGLGLSWAMPFQNALSFAIGALIAYTWVKVHKKTASTFNIPIASGFIAGESITAAVVAILATLSLASAVT